MYADSDLKVEPVSPPCSESHADLSAAGSGIRSPFDFGRLSTHVDMGGLPYIHRIPANNCSEIAIESNLPERGTASASPVAVCYSTPEAAVYSTNTSFNNYGIQYDSSPLPTPISIVGSPSMAERQAAKMAHAFSHDGTHAGRPSPPAASGAPVSEWYNPQNHVMMPSSHPSSPMGIDPSQNLMQMHGMETSQPPQPQALAVDAGDNYWGSYGVSGTEPNDEMSPHMASSVIFQNLPQVAPHVAPSALLKNGYSMHSPSTMPLGPNSPPVPMLGQTTGPGGGIITQMAHMPDPSTFALGNPPLILNMHPSYKRGARSRNPRRPPPKKRQRRQKRNPGDTDMDMDHEEPSATGRTKNVQRILLDDDAPESARFLLDVRYEELHHKGRCLWARIRERFHERYPSKAGPALQMQLKRLVLKHGLWSEEEDRILREAVAEYDEKRYEGIIKIMKARGGCQLWDWGRDNVIKRLVELGEEEYDSELDGKAASRKRKLRRRKQDQELDTQQHDRANPSTSSSHYDEQGRGIHKVAALTAEETEALFQRFYEAEEETPEPDMMHMAEYEQDACQVSAGQEAGQAQSSRVARQACSQLIARQQRDHLSPFYGNPSPGVAGGGRRHQM